VNEQINDLVNEWASELFCSQMQKTFNDAVIGATSCNLQGMTYLTGLGPDY